MFLAEFNLDWTMCVWTFRRGSRLRMNLADLPRAETCGPIPLERRILVGTCANDTPEKLPFAPSQHLRFVQRNVLFDRKLADVTRLLETWVCRARTKS